MMSTETVLNQHLSQRVLGLGSAVAEGAKGLILLHGRAQSPEWITEQVWDRLVLAGWVGLAPQADQDSWYPERFLVPQELNQPHLAQALERVQHLSDDLVAQGIPYRSQVIAGFSQGACLASEFIWRQPQAYGGLLVFTGALLDEQPVIRDPAGKNFKGMPVLFSTWAQDPYVPLEYVQASAQSFKQAGAHVRVWGGAGFEHGIQDQEIRLAVEVLAEVTERITQQGELA